MKIIVGLGNPGEEYQNTRHNAGCQFVDKLAQVLSTKYEVLSNYGWRRKKNIMIWESEDKKWVLVKTAGVFMNESGRMIYELRYMNYDQKHLFVAHDDLDISLEEYKIQLGKGPKEHNGLLSVEQALGTKEFWRIRIGIDNRNDLRFMNYELSGEQYVLQRFLPEEKEVIDRVIEKAAHELVEKNI